MYTIVSFISIPMVILVAFFLTALITVTIANVMAARQDEQERVAQQSEPPAHVSDSASFKREA